jgi:hypothetical protein
MTFQPTSDYCAASSKAWSDELQSLKAEADAAIKALTP